MIVSLQKMDAAFSTFQRLVHGAVHGDDVASLSQSLELLASSFPVGQEQPGGEASHSRGRKQRDGVSNTHSDHTNDTISVVVPSMKFSEHDPKVLPYGTSTRPR